MKMENKIIKKNKHSTLLHRKINPSWGPGEDVIDSVPSITTLC